MSISRLYTADPLSEGQTIALSHRASRHLLQVLRARVGDSVIVFNGKGGEYRGILTGINKGGALIKLLQFDAVNRDSPLMIHLYQGISRGERMDYVFQKASELGVATITPVFTQRCTVKLTEDRLAKRLTHWKSIIISACEQSGRCCLPELKPAINLADCVTQYQKPGFICDTEAKSSITRYPKFESDVSLLIGPEGGFAEPEIQAAKTHGFQGLSLGPRTLRTETAPVVALTLLQAYYGDF